MKIIRPTILLPLTLLVGCVTPQQEAARYNSQILCYGVYAGNNSQKALAAAELDKRGFQCTRDDVAAGERLWAARSTQNATRQQQGQEAAALLLTPPTAAPPQTNCTSTWAYGALHTTCR